MDFEPEEEPAESQSGAESDDYDSDSSKKTVTQTGYN